MGNMYPQEMSLQSSECCLESAKNQPCYLITEFQGSSLYRFFLEIVCLSYSMMKIVYAISLLHKILKKLMYPRRLYVYKYYTLYFSQQNRIVLNVCLTIYMYPHFIFEDVLWERTTMTHSCLRKLQPSILMRDNVYFLFHR